MIRSIINDCFNQENRLFSSLMGGHLCLSAALLYYAHSISPPHHNPPLDVDQVISILEIDFDADIDIDIPEESDITEDTSLAEFDAYSDKETRAETVALMQIQGLHGFSSSGILQSEAYITQSGAYHDGVLDVDLYNTVYTNSNNAQTETLHLSEQHQDYGIGAFTETTKDAHSTFSVDVDTASFTFARKKLHSGIIPVPKSIRTEEFINYFSYGYAQPSKRDVFHVDMKTFIDPIRKDRTYLRVGIKGKELTQKTRPALNLSFLIDVSGSMSDEDKLPLAQASMRLLTESLRPDDVISISTYAGRTAQILPATSGSHKKAILQAIDSLESGGATAMSSGIDLAYEQVWKHFDPQKENRVVVISDGDANVGRTSHGAILDQITSYADRGVTLSTIGFGTGSYNDTLMEQLANRGDGNYYYVDSPKEGHRIFVEGFNSTMISIARDVKIQVEFDPSVVHAYRLIGYENRSIADKDFRNDRVDAGEVGAGHSVTALYELKTTEKRGTLATTRLRYEHPGKDGKAMERVYQLASHQHTPPTKDLKLVYAAATFAEILKNAPHVQDISLDRLKEFVDASQLSSELREMIQQAKDHSLSASK